MRRISLLLALGLACVEDAPPGPSKDDLEAARKDLLAQAPTPKYAANADLDGKVVYLGLDCDQEAVQPGKKFTLTHYWKVVQAPGEGWRLFTHLHGANKTHYMNVDHTPVQGRYPVSTWKAGDIVRDIHEITLPASHTSNVLEVYVGLWRGNERMAIKTGPKDDENRVKAATIPVAGVAATAGGAARHRYPVRRVKDGAIKVDGKLDEAAWASVPPTAPFVDTLTGAAVPQKTTVKAAWDSQHLYVAFENQDDDAWTTLTKRDDKLWTEEVDEIMIDADGDRATYVELQVNPAGTIFDTYLATYRQRTDGWDAGMKAAVKVDGTLNAREDTDKGWVTELAIPLGKVVSPLGDKAAPKGGLTVPPKPGQVWRANFYRMDVPKGQKRQVASGWSPPLVGDFHALDRFGELAFADETGTVPAPAPAAPPAAGTGGAPAPRDPRRHDMRGPLPKQGTMKPLLPAPEPKPADKPGDKPKKKKG